MSLKVRPYLRKIELSRDRIESFEKYPFNIPAIKNLQELDFHEDVTFIIGENGSGKSTLIEAIALSMGFGIEGGTLNVQMQTHDNASPLHKYIYYTKSLIRPGDHYFLRAESFYNVATYMEELNYLSGYGGKSLHHASHGEAFMATILNKLKGNGLYIFDEPEAALSPSRQLAALRAIHLLVKDNSQFIIATHSPILLSYPNAKIIQLDEHGMKEVKYEETEHYLVTKEFLNNPKAMLDILLEEDPD